jgi:hypothetical protein
MVPSQGNGKGLDVGLIFAVCKTEMLRRLKRSFEYGRRNDEGLGNVKRAC